jgi:hypothetical protein
MPLFFNSCIIWSAAYIYQLSHLFLSFFYLFCCLFSQRNSPASETKTSESQPNRSVPEGSKEEKWAKKTIAPSSSHALNSNVESSTLRGTGSGPGPQSAEVRAVLYLQYVLYSLCMLYVLYVLVFICVQNRCRCDHEIFAV